MIESFTLFKILWRVPRSMSARNYRLYTGTKIFAKVTIKKSTGFSLMFVTFNLLCFGCVAAEQLVNG